MLLFFVTQIEKNCASLKPVHPVKRFKLQAFTKHINPISKLSLRLILKISFYCQAFNSFRDSTPFPYPFSLRFYDHSNKLHKISITL